MKVVLRTVNDRLMSLSFLVADQTVRQTHFPILLEEELSHKHSLFLSAAAVVKEREEVFVGP